MEITLTPAFGKDLEALEWSFELQVSAFVYLLPGVYVTFCLSWEFSILESLAFPCPPPPAPPTPGVFFYKACLISLSLDVYKAL